MADSEAIKHFVREKLGCACEDSVFLTIHRSAQSLEDRQTAIRLEIGGRLLVRAISPVDVALLEARLPAWIEQGMAERDAGHLNRFRLVLGANDPSAVEAAGLEILARLPLTDARVHLHVLPIAALAEIDRG